MPENPNEAANPLELKVLMLGGRRAGKTSTLLAMYNCFDENYKNGELTILSIGATSDKMNEKRSEMEGYLNAFIQNNRMLFTPDNGANVTLVSYEFDIKLKVDGGNQKDKKFRQSEKPDVSEESIRLTFWDPPGEWMSNEHKDEIAKRAAEADVLMIILDTPYVMEEGGRYNNLRNRYFDISELVKKSFETSTTPKMVLFVPIKCEKYCYPEASPYTRIPNMEEVANSVVNCYGNLIDRLRDEKQKCEVAITPIQTMGTTEFRGFERYKKNGEGYKRGELIMNNGLPSNPQYRFNEQRAREAAHRKNGGHTYEIEPKDCEQIAIYTLSYALRMAEIAFDLRKRESVERKDRNILDILKDIMKAISDAASRLSALIQGSEDANAIKKRYNLAVTNALLKQRGQLLDKMKRSGNGYRILSDVLDFQDTTKQGG